MLGATVLLVLGAERLLLVVLAPGVLGSAAFLLLGRPAALEHAVWVALAATPLLALGLSTARTQPWPRSRPLNARGSAAGSTGGTALAAGAGLGRADLRGALPAPASAWSPPGCWSSPSPAACPASWERQLGAVLASLPLALSMGVAEWSLIWFRRRTQRLLRNTRKCRPSPSGPGWSLLAALAAVPRRGDAADRRRRGDRRADRAHPSRTGPSCRRVTAYLLLGGSMFLALLLQAFGSRTFPLVACAVALAFEVGVAAVSEYSPDRGVHRSCSWCWRATPGPCWGGRSGMPTKTLASSPGRTNAIQ